MTDVLRVSDSARRRGTASLIDLNRPAGVKSGQTEDGRDLWTVGGTPSRAVAVWMGGESAFYRAGLRLRARADETLLCMTCLPTVGRSLRAWSPWTRASASGPLPTDAVRSWRARSSSRATQPVNFDDLYHLFAINREEGLLATIFTLPALVDEEVFMVVLEVARDRAAPKGILSAETYDTIEAEPRQPGRGNRLAGDVRRGQRQRSSFGLRQGQVILLVLPVAIWQGPNRRIGADWR